MITSLYFICSTNCIWRLLSLNALILLYSFYLQFFLRYPEFSSIASPCFLKISPVLLQASKSENTPYPQGLKGEDLELGEDFISRSFPNGTVPGTPSSGNNNTSAPPSRRAPYDFLLLGAIIDRACLVLYIIIIISNVISFNSVLFGRPYSTDAEVIEKNMF